MKLIAQVKIQPMPEQAEALRHTLELANEACNYLSGRAWEAGVFRQYNLHKLAYYDTREQFPDLSSQIVVRCIARVADAYKLDQRTKPTFKPMSAIAYDERILRWYVDKSLVSIWAVGGRAKLSFVCGEYQRALLRSQQGQSDLVFRKGEWYLHATCNVEEPDLIETEGVFGIDLGIVNLATDSDGESYSGEAVEKNRRIQAYRRRNLQRKGTKSAKRKLRQLAGKQANFQRNENHRISNRIVRKAKDTNRAIAVENLTGIRSRTTVRRRQRARYANWSFYQLKQFVSYKAQLAAVPLIEVDPRYTSQACSVCGCISKANRPDQSTFSCVSCGYSANADHNAAVNIAARAASTSQTAQAKVSDVAFATVPGTSSLLWQGVVDYMSTQI